MEKISGLSEPTVLKNVSNDNSTNSHGLGSEQQDKTPSSPKHHFVHVDSKSDTEADIQSNVKSETEAETKTETKAEENMESKAEAKVEAESTTDAQDAS